MRKYVDKYATSLQSINSARYLSLTNVDAVRLLRECSTVNSFTQSISIGITDTLESKIGQFFRFIEYLSTF